MRWHYIPIATAQVIALLMLGALVRQQVHSALHYVTVEEERIKKCTLLDDLCCSGSDEDLSE